MEQGGQLLGALLRLVHQGGHTAPQPRLVHWLCQPDTLYGGFQNVVCVVVTYFVVCLVVCGRSFLWRFCVMAFVNGVTIYGRLCEVFGCGFWYPFFCWLR